MRLHFERFYPYVLAAIAVLTWYRSGVTLPAEREVLSSSLTMGAILTGFLATSKAILMSLDTPIMQRIRATSYHLDLASYLGQAIWISFIFCCFILVGFFIDHQAVWYGATWIAIGVAAGSAFIRVTHIMLKIIRHQ